MIPYRIIALPTQIAEEVRTIGKAPRYGHPAITEVAKGYGPCRHCLRTFAVGVERRTLFTYDSFDTVEAVIERLFARPDIDYIQVHDTEAGCYDFRIERP